MSLSSYEPEGQDSGGLSWSRMSSLPVGQELEIRGTKYCVMGRVHNRQDDYRWVEYDIQTDAGIGAWLSVDPSSGDGCVLSLHDTIPFPKKQFQDNVNSVNWKGKVYELVDQGEAVVTGYKGRGDYDYNEFFKFDEYRSPSGKILTFEYWADEREASIGSELAHGDVKILGVRHVSVETSSRSIKGYLEAMLSFFGLFLMLYEVVLPSFNMTPRIERQLSSSLSFRLVTYVSMSGGENGKVYSTSRSVDETCRAIIAMDPERIAYVTTASEDVTEGEEPERMLRTSRETVMIYQSEDGGTYVQVSPNEDNAERGYTSYRARRPFRLGRLFSGSRQWESLGRPANTGEFYDIDTKRYEPDVASARQASVSARRSSGGSRGGFGK